MQVVGSDVSPQEVFGNITYRKALHAQCEPSGHFSDEDEIEAKFSTLFKGFYLPILAKRRCPQKKKQ